MLRLTKNNIIKAVAFATAFTALAVIFYLNNDTALTETNSATASVNNKNHDATFKNSAESSSQIKSPTRLSKSDFYTSRSYSQLIADSKVGGVDTVAAANYSYKLCNYLYGTGHDFASFIASREKRSNPGLDQSAQYLDAYRKRTCDMGVDSSGSKLYDELQNDLLEAANRTLDKEYIGIIDIQTKLSNGEEINNEQLDSLTSIIGATDSPATFIEAANLLATHGGSDWNIGKNYIYGTAQEDTLSIVRQGGVALAYCQIYKVCGPESIVSINSCVPYNCAQGVSYSNIVRNNMTPEQYRIASRIAQDIIRSRKR